MISTHWPIWPKLDILQWLPWSHYLKIMRGVKFNFLLPSPISCQCHWSECQSSLPQICCQTPSLTPTISWQPCTQHWSPQLPPNIHRGCSQGWCQDRALGPHCHCGGHLSGYLHKVLIGYPNKIMRNNETLTNASAVWNGWGTCGVLPAVVPLPLIGCHCALVMLV